MNFYELSKQLNRNNKELLWYWIIGMSNLIIHERVGEFEYTEEVRQCNEEVLRMHPSMSNQEYHNLQADGQQGQDPKEKVPDSVRVDNLFKMVQRDPDNQEPGTICME